MVIPEGTLERHGHQGELPNTLLSESDAKNSLLAESGNLKKNA